MREQHHIKHLNPHAAPIGPEDIVCLILIRNELARLPELLAYYRDMGVDRFIILDNDSTDGVTEYLATQADVQLFYTRASYAASRCGVLWQNLLLDAFCIDRWCLVVDADEYFVFPDCERLGLKHLCSYLDQHGNEAVPAMLIDRYSDQRLQQIEDARGQSLQQCYPFYDSDGYQAEKISDFFPALRITGGPRKRVIWDTLRPGFPSPILNKVPLLKWRKGASLRKSTHYIAPMKLAQIRTVLMHFKFTGDFKARVLQAVEEENHSMHSREYKVYLEALTEMGEQSLMYQGSVSYESSKQLAGLGLISAPDDYS